MMLENRLRNIKFTTVKMSQYPNFRIFLAGVDWITAPDNILILYSSRGEKYLREGTSLLAGVYVLSGTCEY